jgi:hypothetical protein
MKEALERSARGLDTGTPSRDWLEKLERGNTSTHEPFRFFFVETRKNADDPELTPS